MSHDLEAETPDEHADNLVDEKEGGFQGWLAVLGGWCCLFVSFGWITCIGLFQEYYETHQLSNYSHSEVAWIPATETFMMFIGASVGGKIFDSYGPRPLLLGGTLLHVVGLVCVSFSRTYAALFLSQSVCSAMGSAAIMWAGNNAVGTWFKRRRALALGIVSSGSSVGALIGTAVIPTLFRSIGFAWTMRSVAITYLILMIVANLTVTSKVVHKPTRLDMSEFIQPLADPAVFWLAVASFLFFAGVFLPYNFLVIQSRYIGMSQRMAEYTVSILSATSIFGRIVPGWLGDRYGRFNIMILTTFLSVALVLGLWIPAENNLLNILFAAFFGASSGTFVAMVPALVAQVCPDIKKIGVYTGVTYMVICPAVLASQPLAGALISANDGDYTYLQVFCGLAMFVGGIFFVVARAAHGGAGWRKI
ncbi:monocarboxylate permease-like protein [Amniculicola lignicola CBS 123094]|uniref:Monocarboxylate permease-like protein n=1 Tax=Amniculicola lignicola CBS 123094 TaxID=1392246 RepID=A0A6A5WVK0_9PLEO|nr:monocarboxylate permease-like protein [Amniculicola lignicola CBS 123094]